MFNFVIALLCISAACAQEPEGNTATPALTTTRIQEKPQRNETRTVQQNNTRTQEETTIKKVAVDVYYEALCPYARAFITDQLHPALSKDLGKYITLTLHPYGKAKTNRTGDNITFTCHHDKEECIGNKYHACALKLIDNGDQTFGFGYNKDALEYVNCLAKTKAENPDEKCRSVAKNYADQIKLCANGKQGDEFLEEYGKSTNNFQNPLGNVPSITFNTRLSKEGENNFVGEVCKHFGTAKPTECDKRPKNSAYPTEVAIGIFSVVLAVLFM